MEAQIRVQQFQLFEPLQMIVAKSEYGRTKKCICAIVSENGLPHRRHLNWHYPVKRDFLQQVENVVSRYKQCPK